jgi:hypothetical protein
MTATRCPRCGTAHRDAASGALIVVVPLVLLLAFEATRLTSGPLFVVLLVIQAAFTLIAGAAGGLVWSVMRAQRRGWLS